MEDVHRQAVRIVFDRDRGASAIGGDLRELLVPYTGSAEAGARLARELLTAKPVMAPILHIANHLLGGPEPAPTPRDLGTASHSIGAADKGEKKRLDPSVKDAVRRARRLLPESGGRVMTYSASGTVEAVLEALHADGLLTHVYLSEAQPGGEGRALAARLTADWGPRGTEVFLTHDAALASLVPRVDLLTIGADLVLPRGLVNKVGTAQLVERAHREGVPVLVAAAQEKAPPKGVRQAHLPLPLETEAGELTDPPTGVRTVGLAFEWVDIRGRALPKWASDPDVPPAEPELIEILEGLVEARV